MLTQEENDFLTRVGPGTPGGEFLRRYWHPVAPAAELTAEQTTRFVRILGEDLVLFRDLSGRVGLVADRCSHRGCSLLYGRVEERGISCAYHGWLFDTAGNILETPPERNDAIIRRVKHRAYPVQEFCGLYWAYLGPQPAPCLPRYDLWARQDGWHRVVVSPRLDCNWLQAMENSVDPAHLMILHQEHIARGRKPVSTTRGFIDDIGETEFDQTEFGIIKRRLLRNGEVEAHPVIFPNILRQANGTQIRVPIDDTHTWHVHVEFFPTEDGSTVEQDEIPVLYVKPYKDLPEELHPRARFRQDTVLSQDHMAWETQGPIADRTQENLSYSDKGVFLLRKMMRENIERVLAGQDPIAVVRDPDHEMIDTGLAESITAMRNPNSLSGRAQGGVDRLVRFSTARVGITN